LSGIRRWFRVGPPGCGAADMVVEGRRRWGLSKWTWDRLSSAYSIAWCFFPTQLNSSS
jgi:hypothetical protein